MNSKIKFYKSIQFKIALVFALMLMLTLEVVGAVFVRQLERQNMTTFKQQVELPTYVNNSLASQLTKPNESQANKQIKAILASINNNTITEIRVIDGKGVIRGTSLANTQGSVGQRTTDKTIKATLATNRAHTEHLYDNNTHDRYFVNVVPLVNPNNANEVVGVAYLKANLEGVYTSINNISLIYFASALLTIIFGLGLAILIAREITRPIEEMRKKTLQIARGDYSGRLEVAGNDELGQLAGAVNNLSVRIEESQESSAAERRRFWAGVGFVAAGIGNYYLTMRYFLPGTTVLYRALTPAGLWLMVDEKRLPGLRSWMEYNFFLYAVHFALVRLLNKTAAFLAPPSVWFPITLYLVMPFLMAAVSYRMASVLQRFAPGVWRVLNGRR